MITSACELIKLTQNYEHPRVVIYNKTSKFASKLAGLVSLAVAGGVKQMSDPINEARR